MGLQHSFQFSGPAPGWGAIRPRLGEPLPAVRMIDGLPAFPDEEPPADWKELRLASAGGMITLRRTGDQIAVVTWGTDDPALTADRVRVGAALESLGGTPLE